MKRLLIMIALLFITTEIKAEDSASLVGKQIVVAISTNVEDKDQIGKLVVKLYNKTSKKVIQTENPKLSFTAKDPVTPNVGKLGFEFNIVNPLLLGNDYVLQVFSSGFLWKSFDLKPIVAEFVSLGAFPQCKGAIPFRLKGMQGPKNSVLASQFWSPILKYLDPEQFDPTYNPNNANPDRLKKLMVVKTSWGSEIKTLDLASVYIGGPMTEDGKTLSVDKVKVYGNVLLCLAPKTKPTSGSFNISVSFINPIVGLGGEFQEKDLSWGGTTAIKSSDSLPDKPDARQIDKNLDLGVSFTSSVVRDATTNIDQRETNWILDVRLAPWLKKIKYNGKPWVKQWTPAILNANVASGKITKSTVSLNRIILGTEFEWNYVPAFKQAAYGNNSNTAGFIDYYRIKLSGNHASDRDLKQREITGKVEFQPVWSKFNKPRETNWKYIPDSIIADKQIVEYKKFGFEIVPKLGFEFGKTYHRRNPAEGIDASDFVQRLYGGIDMKFDITSHLSINLTNTLYGRYELKKDRLRNYFKGEIYAPLSNPLRNTTNGLFITFEKGDAPPFTGTVNVLKFGYRIQSNGWGGF
jgi:hypothetical protein